MLGSAPIAAAEVLDFCSASLACAPSSGGAPRTFAISLKFVRSTGVRTGRFSAAAGPAARNGTTFFDAGTTVSTGFASSAVAVCGGTSARPPDARRAAAALSAATSRQMPKPR